LLLHCKKIWLINFREKVIYDCEIVRKICLWLWESYTTHNLNCGQYTEIWTWNHVVHVVSIQLTLGDWFSACQNKSIRAIKTAATVTTNTPIMTYTLLRDVKLFIIFVALLATPSVPRINNVAGRLVSANMKYRVNDIRCYLSVNVEVEGTSEKSNFLVMT
jgi:hypothetical protein